MFLKLYRIIDDFIYEMNLGRFWMNDFFEEDEEHSEVFPSAES